MCDVQAVVEVFLNFTRFCNLDLRYVGFYQIRCNVKSNKRLPIRIDISIPRSKAPHLFPANLVNGQAVGTTFEVMYKSEEISLDDIVQFKIFHPISSSAIPKVLPIAISLELWFIEKSELLKKPLDDVNSKFQCVSKRMVTVNLPLFRGLHNRRPVLFDYFHLSSVLFTVHACLVGLALGPSLSVDDALGRANDRFSRYGASVLNSSQSNEEIFFRNLKSQDRRVQNAHQFHYNVCWLLLTVYEALELKFAQLIACLPSHCQIRIQSVDCAKKFEILQQNLQRLRDETEISQLIANTVKLLSTELALLWRQFLDLFKSQPEVNKRLANEHHHLRVRRFAENFLCTENSTGNLLSNTLGQTQKRHEALVDLLRKSDYFTRLPPLPVSCNELDGSPALTPIIFEERFAPTRDRPSVEGKTPIIFEERFAHTQNRPSVEGAGSVASCSSFDDVNADESSPMTKNGVDGGKTR